MEMLGDVVGRDRRSGATALRVPGAGRSYDYRRFCTSTWKVGNFLRQLGVRRGAGVAVADDPLPESVLAFYGAALLGGVVSFGTGLTAGDGADAVGDTGEPRTDDTHVVHDADVRAVVVPEGDLDRWPVGPGTKRVAYGGRPADPSVSHFERDVWSENPTEPPDPVSPDDPLLRTGGTTWSHRAVLQTAESVVAVRGLGGRSTVRVEGSFVKPGVVVAGLVAPLLAGGSTVLGAGDVHSAVYVDPDADEPDADKPDADKPDADKPDADKPDEEIDLEAEPDPAVDADADADLVVGGPHSDIDVASLLTPDT